MKLSCRLFLFFFILISFLEPGFAQKMRVLPLGNSITHDYNTDDDDGTPRPASIKISYRYKLYQLFNAAGYKWDFIGNEQCGSNYLPYSTIDSLDYTDNAGYPGITPEHLTTILTTGRDPRDNSCLIESKFGSCPNNYLQKYLPDIILLHIGTNVLNNESDAASHAQAVNTILNTVDAYETWAGKQVVVFLAKIINRQSASGNPEHIVTTYYNSLLEALVTSRTGDKIVLVNMETGANINYRNVANGGDMFDTWHPANSGYEKMAVKWFEAIDNYNLKAPNVGNIPDINFTNSDLPKQVNLNPYVFDPQDPDDEMTWSTTSASTKFNISFLNGVATITPKIPSQSATETITFKAQDSGNGGTPLFDTDVCTITYTVNNQTPVITGPDEFTINEDAQITFSLSSFQVTDDDPYPGNFSLYINENDNYSIINTYTVKPDLHFNGTLTVPVYVNDGLANSEIKEVIININPVNDPPIINLPESRTITEGSSYFSTITAEDPDQDPNVSISILGSAPSWLNHSGSSASIDISGTPDDADIGLHSISFRATDTKVITDSILILEVIGVNDIPVITGITHELYTPQNVSYTITLNDLRVTDPDNTYPDDFSLSIQDGDNYSISGNTIIPSQGFMGIVTVPVIVNDGISDSEPKDIPVSVGLTSSGYAKDNEVINLFPNPVSSILRLELKDDKGCIASILDLTGRVYTTVVVARNVREYEIPVGNIPNGLYLVKVIHPSRTIIEKIEILH